MISAHGVGSGSDLPIPATYAILAGTAALVLSFAVLVMAWRATRYADGEGGRPVPILVTRLVDHPVTASAVRALGLAVLGFAVWCVVAGQDDLTNPVFGIVYVVLWVGLVPASLLLGPFVRAISPGRTLHLLIARVASLDPDRGPARIPGWVGCWPAAAGLLSFTWMELVSPAGTQLTLVAGWFLAYFVVTIGGGLLFGREWFARADPFEVYSTLVSHLSVWSRDRTGRIELVSPLRNLARLRPAAGLTVVVSVLLGSTAFDSFRDSTSWLRFTQDTDLDVVVLETGLLLCACTVVGLAFWAATAWLPTARGGTRGHHPRRLAHSLVPIIVGYMVAHYLTLFVETGQLTLIQASDPLGTGMNLFGTADRRVDIWLSLHPSFLALVKVLAIVTGHLVGVVAAHDRAIALLPQRHQVAGQLPLLGVMVVYTFGGLYLLFGS